MKTGRFSLILVWAILLDCQILGTAFAAFGFGGDDAGKSGLDFAGGYDVNTVITVSGKVSALPRADNRKHSIIEITTRKERMYLYVGPPSYWDKKGITVHINDAVLAKGSKAQGEDGKSYLITQKLTNQTTGAQQELRDEKGEPAWSAHDHPTLHHDAFTGGMGGMRGGMSRMGRGRMGR